MRKKPSTAEKKMKKIKKKLSNRAERWTRQMSEWFVYENFMWRFSDLYIWYVHSMLSMEWYIWIANVINILYGIALYPIEGIRDSRFEYDFFFLGFLGLALCSLFFIVITFTDMYRWTDGDAEINVNFQENCSLYKHAVVWYLCIHYSLFTTDNTQHYNIINISNVKFSKQRNECCTRTISTETYKSSNSVLVT